MAGRTPLILVTRPQPQAGEWAQQLNGSGLNAHPLPLIDIAPPHDLQAVHTAWQLLHTYRLVILVSPNAAQAFVQHRPPSTSWPSTTWAAAPGPGTADALKQYLAQAGMPLPTLFSPPPDSPQFDSEHLWPLLAAHAWAQQRVLIVSGGQAGQAQGRAWLSSRLQAAGAAVDTVVAYGRQAASWSPEQQQMAAQAYQSPHDHQWLFSSSEAVAHLVAKLGPPPANARAIATHPRIADTACQAGFTHVLSASPRCSELVHALTTTGLDTISPP